MSALRFALVLAVVAQATTEDTLQDLEYGQLNSEPRHGFHHGHGFHQGYYKGHHHGHYHGRHEHQNVYKWQQVHAAKVPTAPCSDVKGKLDHVLEEVLKNLKPEDHHKVNDQYLGEQLAKNPELIRIITGQGQPPPPPYDGGFGKPWHHRPGNFGHPGIYWPGKLRPTETLEKPDSAPPKNSSCDEIRDRLQTILETIQKNLTGPGVLPEGGNSNRPPSGPDSKPPGSGPPVGPPDNGPQTKPPGPTDSGSKPPGSGPPSGPAGGNSAEPEVVPPKSESESNELDSGETENSESSEILRESKEHSKETEESNESGEPEFLPNSNESVDPDFTRPPVTGPPTRLPDVGPPISSPGVAGPPIRPPGGGPSEKPTDAGPPIRPPGGGPFGKPTDAGPPIRPPGGGPSGKPTDAGPPIRPPGGGPSEKPTDAGPATNYPGLWRPEDFENLPWVGGFDISAIFETLLPGGFKDKPKNVQVIYEAKLILVLKHLYRLIDRLKAKRVPLNQIYFVVQKFLVLVIPKFAALLAAECQRTAYFTAVRAFLEPLTLYLNKIDYKPNESHHTVNFDKLLSCPLVRSYLKIFKRISF